MKNFKISVEYKMYGTVDVEAESLEKAIEYAKENIDDLPLPDDADYIGGTYEINDKATRMINDFNKNATYVKAEPKKLSNEEIIENALNCMEKIWGKPNGQK